ncbi:hypothetical protein HO411_05020, partial [Streptococcus suis]|nr:hypothetical protein [Streptococcus suis]
AKADADKAIDVATDASGVAKALEAGKATIDAINTTTSAEKAAAKKDLEAAYNAKKAEIANSGYPILLVSLLFLQLSNLNWRFLLS